MIIKSLLDTDLYKLTMQQAVLELYPNAVAEYRFINRGHHRFDKEFPCPLEYCLSMPPPNYALHQQA